MKKITIILLLMPVMLLTACVHVRTAVIGFSEARTPSTHKYTTWMVDHGSAQVTEARIYEDGSYLEWLNGIITASKATHFTVVDYEITKVPWLPLSSKQERRIFSVRYIVRTDDNRSDTLLVDLELSRDDVTRAVFTPGIDDYYQATAVARAHDVRRLLTQAGQELLTRIKHEN